MSKLSMLEEKITASNKTENPYALKNKPVRIFKSHNDFLRSERNRSLENRYESSYDLYKQRTDRS